MYQLAPIAISTYSRLEHLTQTINALRRNTLAIESELYIFSDAPKPGDEDVVNNVRAYLHTVEGFKKVHIVERKTNSRVENNRGGIKQLLKNYGKCIFLEEDVVTASGFLAFMNLALTYYKDYDDILSVAGHTPNLDCHIKSRNDVYLSRRFHGWGVGFWDHKFNNIEEVPEWTFLKKDKDTIRVLKTMGRTMTNLVKSESDGDIDALDVKACYTCAKHGYVNLLPIKTLVKNIGLDGSGLHCGENDPYISNALWEKQTFTMIKGIKIDNNAMNEYKKFYSPKRKIRIRSIMRFINNKMKIPTTSSLANNE